MQTKNKSAKKITLVVLSYGKQDYLRRLIYLYKELSYHLIIVDGSNSPWKSDKSGVLENLSWEYFAIPSPQRTFKNYSERFIRSVNLVTSPYMVFIDDEEFLFPSGIKSAINFLESNPSYSAAGGQIFVVDTENQHRVSTWGRKSTMFELSEDKSIDRMMKLVFHQRTANLMYQVVPTGLYKKFVKILSLSNFANSIRFHSSLEIFQSLFLSQQGNWQMHSYPYWIRIIGPSNENTSEINFLSASEIKLICRNLFKYGTKECYSLEKIMDVCWGGNSDYYAQLKTSLNLKSKKKISKYYIFKHFFKKIVKTKNLNQFEGVSLEEIKHFIKTIKDYPMGISEKEFDYLSRIE